jgi:hypothetical protein
VVSEEFAPRPGDIVLAKIAADDEIPAGWEDAGPGTMRRVYTPGEVDLPAVIGYVRDGRPGHPTTWQ